MTAQEREQTKQWVETWKVAGIELRKIKMAELAAMTDEDTRQAVDWLLSEVLHAYKHPRYDSYSGLIDQQQYFHRNHLQQTKCQQRKNVYERIN